MNSDYFLRKLQKFDNLLKEIQNEADDDQKKILLKKFQKIQQLIHQYSEYMSLKKQTQMITQQLKQKNLDLSLDIKKKQSSIVDVMSILQKTLQNIKTNVKNIDLKNQITTDDLLGFAIDISQNLQAPAQFNPQDEGVVSYHGPFPFEHQVNQSRLLFCYSENQGQCKEPIISLINIHTAQEYDKGQKVIAEQTAEFRITTSDESFIHYTTDGSLPSALNGIYLEQQILKINDSCDLKLIAFNYRYEESKLITRNIQIKENHYDQNKVLRPDYKIGQDKIQIEHDTPYSDQNTPYTTREYSFMTPMETPQYQYTPQREVQKMDEFYYNQFK